jgi:hypothetical protein
LSLHIAGRLIILGAVLAASTAFAQPAPDASAIPVAPNTTAADIAPAPGLPGPQSVDPAPGARGAYAGHSEHAFYDVDRRIEHLQSRIATDLTGVQQKRAMSDLSSIKTEEKEQIARHGDLLDWARENLNHRLDVLLQTYPTLAG